MRCAPQRGLHAVINMSLRFPVHIYRDGGGFRRCFASPLWSTRPAPMRLEQEVCIRGLCGDAGSYYSLAADAGNTCICDGVVATIPGM
mgnify:CR=1 FL=1